MFSASLGFAIQGPENAGLTGSSSDLAGFGLGLFDAGGCTLGIEGTVITDAGGGDDTFTFSIVDQGAVVASQDFSLPADGAAHPFDASIDLDHLFADGTYDFVVDDPGGVGHIEFVNITAPASCMTVSVPTLSTGGVALFALVLAAGALWIVARQRRA